MLIGHQIVVVIVLGGLTYQIPVLDNFEAVVLLLGDFSVRVEEVSHYVGQKVVYFIDRSTVTLAVLEHDLVLKLFANRGLVLKDKLVLGYLAQIRTGMVFQRNHFSQSDVFKLLWRALFVLDLEVQGLAIFSLV